MAVGHIAAADMGITLLLPLSVQIHVAHLAVGGGIVPVTGHHIPHQQEIIAPEFTS